MKYSQFQALALVIGAAAVLSAIAIGPIPNPQTTEIIAQLLIIFVLAGALYFGRNGGFLAAIIATGTYVLLRIPLLTSQGLTSDLLVMLTVRVLTYAIVGIVGGEICGRIKYVFARMEDTALVDHVTGVYNARYAGTAIGTGVGLYRRYQVPYSVVILTCGMHDAITDKPKRFRTTLRHLANHVRNDIRVVDDLAHLGEGVFAVLLPHTPLEGARVCAERVKTGAEDLLGADAKGIAIEVFSAATDGDALCDLGNRLTPESGTSVCEPSADVVASSAARPDRRETVA